MHPEVKIWNTLSSQEDFFLPLNDKEVRIYSCGPTVYHYAHLGNLRAYVFADTLRRMLIHANYDVKHVINITDVGHLVGDGDVGVDKLEEGSKREGKTAWEIAKFYEEAFYEDLALLNIPKSKYKFPKATEHIKEQIELVTHLELKGYTYKTSDGIYFDSSKFKDYGKLAKLNIEGLKSGARVEENKEKKHITDFALWKFSKPEERRQMEWDSPWGKGFPGWHLECSAMSEKLLGAHFDIHTGGIDHISVHHTNEIAQSEAANGGQYVKYWMHCNFLNDKSGKMSKSKGDFLRLQTLLDEGINPLSYRYYLLTVHYRSEINFSFESLGAATTAYEKLVAWCGENKSNDGKININYKREFEKAIFNDLGTPEAIAYVWKIIKDDYVKNEDKYATIISFDEVLGLNLKEAQISRTEVGDDIKSLVLRRKEAKESKNWEEADKLRKEIEEAGFKVKDLPTGETLIEK